MSTQEIEQETLPEGDENLAEEVAEPEGEIVEQEPEPLEPAPKWDRRYKDAFSELGSLDNGRNYQQAMLDLYNEVQGYATKIEQEKKTYGEQVETWNGVFSPYQDFLNRNGLDPQTAARQGLGFMMSLSQDPKSFVEQLAKRAGVQLATDEDAPYVPPEVKALQEEIERLKSGQQQTQQQWIEQERARVAQQIQSFANEKDASGNPAHPHFDAVKDHMAGLINQGMAPDIGTAYEMACRLNPEISDKPAKPDVTELAAKSKEAKKATIAAKRPPGKSAGKDTTKTSQVDAIRAALREQAA